MMNIEKEIKTAFNLTPETIISDDYIQNNQDLMWIKKDIDTLMYVPSYMLWCLKNKDSEGSLVCDFILKALAEYGRATDKENSYLNFKYLCNLEQKSIVHYFLKWCEENIESINKEQLQRTLKRWTLE